MPNINKNKQHKPKKNHPWRKSYIPKKEVFTDVDIVEMIQRLINQIEGTYNCSIAYNVDEVKFSREKGKITKI